MRSPVALQINAATRENFGAKKTILKSVAECARRGVVVRADDRGRWMETKLKVAAVLRLMSC